MGSRVQARLMVGLRLWLMLVLVYQVTSNYHGATSQTVDNVIKTFDKIIHHKHHNNIHKQTDFKQIGKFKPSTIGRVLNNPKSTKKFLHQFADGEEQENKNNKIVKEFETFTQHKQSDHDKAVARRSHNQSDEKIAQLENLISSTEKLLNITESPVESVGNISTKENDINIAETTTVKTNSTEHIISDQPKPLALTSDSHQKRGILQELPDNDGTFVFAVIGVALGCIVAVVGVGYFLHRPACNRSCTPFSDNSPTFQSAKLAFSSSPEEKLNNSLKVTKTNSSKEAKSGDNSANLSRSFKFKENTDNNNIQGHMYNYKGTMRQESLIDIDGPEEDDDMIYECPGLAPHGEMEVTNPFFLQKDFNMNMDTVEENKSVEKIVTAASIHPCPISSASNIRHGSIFRNTQPGQQ